MREILFRGKRKDNGEWLEGSALFADNKAFIFNNVKVEFFNGHNEYRMNFTLKEVIPETVGQYTGLTDKNGRKIFEGDIVHAIYQSNYVGMKNIDFGIGVVEYCGNYYSHASYEINIIGEIGSRVFSASLEGGVEVIGNIYDNPELLRGGADNDR